MLRALLIVPCIVAALSLPGCGQSGALYFDEAPPPDQLPPSHKTSSVAPVSDPVPGPATD